jgi:dTDP-glucose pyrophosphorylase
MNKLQQFLVSEGETVLTSMKKLDDNAHKILFVIDKSEELIGSITDGDIRRWILGGNELSAEVRNVCNNSPIFVSENYLDLEIKDLMLTKNIECIPVLSSDKIVKEILFWTDVFQDIKVKEPKKKMNYPVVIMAGGSGTRLAPFTTILPKPLIPVGDKSIVEHIIDRFLPYGIDNFYLTVNHKSKIIKSYFEDVEKEYSLKFVKEDKPLGTAGSLKLVKDEVDDVFIVTNCDIIIHADYSKIVDFHISSGYDITLVSSMMHYKIPYGICEIDKGGSLIEVREKPEYNFLISTGMYILNKKVLDLIPDNEFFHITHLIEKVKKHGGSVGVFPISEKSWDDTGEWDEYIKAVKRLTND